MLQQEAFFKGASLRCAPACGSEEGHVSSLTQRLAALPREDRAAERHALGYLISRRWRWSIGLLAISFALK